MKKLRPTYYCNLYIALLPNRRVSTSNPLVLRRQDTANPNQSQNKQAEAQASSNGMRLLYTESG